MSKQALSMVGSGGKGKVLIMAAGTGGHVFPGLAIARCLEQRGVIVEWLGTPAGMENDLLNGTNYKLHRITVSGLRGTGFRRKLSAPMMLSRALSQSLQTIRQVRPDCVLGMGGFVCGPAGLATKMLGIPLVIHEQNAVAGVTNRLLAKVANRVVEAFPGTFSAAKKVHTLGNPLREEIIGLREQKTGHQDRYRPLHVLVLGGSRGAKAINSVIPEVVANWGEIAPLIYHQTGAVNFTEIEALYRSLDIELGKEYRVVPFISDMAEAYRWADLVIARSGASTVSELAAVGMPSILVPYPHHKDQQQLLNARWLADKGAAHLIVQDELSAKSLLAVLRDLDRRRDRLDSMSEASRRLGVVDAAEKITAQCLELMYA